MHKLPAEKFSTLKPVKPPYHVGEDLMGDSDDFRTPQLTSRRTRLGLILLAWTVPALVFAILTHSRMVALGEESSFWIWLADHLASWYTWAALSPLIVWLARRYRLDRTPRTRSVIIHLAGAVMVALMHSAAAVLASIILHSEPRTWAHVSDVYIRWLAWNSPWSLVIYGVVIAGTYAVDYYGRARDERLRAVELESQFSRAQFDALQQQLQPHFLFNTLNSISVLMQKGDVAGSTAMLNRLSDLLRYVLRRDGRQEVQLADELDFVRRYLEIEQTRFGDRLRVDYKVAPDTLPYRVPSFLLQLLVENSVRHGIARKAGIGHVTISASRDNGRLRMSVEDDGVGIDSEPSGEPEGIGIRNARQRLRLLYGDDYTLDLTSREPAGASASLEIPARS